MVSNWRWADLDALKKIEQSQLQSSGHSLQSQIEDDSKQNQSDLAAL